MYPNQAKQRASILDQLGWRPDMLSLQDPAAQDHSGYYGDRQERQKLITKRFDVLRVDIAGHRLLLSQRMGTRCL